MPSATSQPESRAIGDCEGASYGCGNRLSVTNISLVTYRFEWADSPMNT